MNQCDPPIERNSPGSAKDHFDECPWCAEEMAEDPEFVEVIQKSLWDSLSDETPPPEVWDRIRARLPERRQTIRGERMAWAWPQLLSNAVVVGLLIVVAGLTVWRPFWLGKQNVVSLPTAYQVDSQAGWRGVDERAPALHNNGDEEEIAEPIVVAALPGGTGTYGTMTREGLLSVGYLHRLQRPPRSQWKEPVKPGLTDADASGGRNPLP
jgi:hypothetical protein